MSSPKIDKDTKKTVTLEELVARASELKEHIDALESTLNMYLNQYKEIQLSFETLKNLPESPVEGYMVLDRLSSVMIPVIVSENWASNIIVNLGLGYYIKTNKDKAVEILTKRLGEVEKVINSIQSQRKAAVEEYLGIQRIISQVVESQQAKTK